MGLHAFIFIRIKKMRFFIILLLIGLILRVVLSIQIYSGDVNNHISWGKDAINFGSAGIYEREFYPKYGTLSPNYPPIPIFLFTIFYTLYDWVYKNSWSLNLTVPIFPSNFIFFLQDQDTLPAFLKIPSMFADIGIAAVIFLFTRRMDKKKDSYWLLVAPSLILFNPAFFYNSTYWGQIEAIPLFFVLLAFYFLIYSNRFLLSSVFFTLAVLSKQTTAVFFPVFVVYFFLKFGFKNSLKSLFLSTIVFWLMFLPFYKSGNILIYPFTTYWNKIQIASVSDFITDHAFNFWALTAGLGKISDSLPFLLGISFQVWGYVIFALLSLVAIYAIYRYRGNDQIILLSTVLVSFGSFMFLTRMHERHLEAALPFLLLLGTKDKKILLIFLYLSVFHFLNLYHNWWAPRFGFLVEILSSVTVINILIAVAVGTFLVLLLKLLRFLHCNRP